MGRGLTPACLDVHSRPQRRRSPTRLSTLVVVAGWLTLHVKHLLDKLWAGTVTVLLRE